MQPEPSDLDRLVTQIRQSYPLPIAFQLRQLERAESGQWKLRCACLRNLVWFSFRYLTVAILSNYLRMNELGVRFQEWDEEAIQARQEIRSSIDQALGVDDSMLQKLDELVERDTHREREILVNLRHILDERFDLESLRTLCFDLGVDYEDLPGEGQAAKARELVDRLEKRRRLSDLVVMIVERRSDISWRDVLAQADDLAALELSGDLKQWWQAVKAVVGFWENHVPQSAPALSGLFPDEETPSAFLMSLAAGWLRAHQEQGDQLIGWYDAFVAINEDDPGALQNYFETLYGKSLQFLETLDFLTDFPLVCVQEPRAGQTRDGKRQWTALQYMGEDPKPERVIVWHDEGKEFAGEYLNKLALVDGAKMEAPLLLLHPLAIFHLPEIVAQSAQGELSILNDWIRDGRGLRYRLLEDTGLKPAWVTLDDYVEALQALLERSVAVPELELSDWEELRRGAARTTLPNREMLSEGKYDEEHYLEREEIVERLSQFRQAPAPGLVVVGDAGVGKTSLLCHWSGELLKEPNSTVLLYDCRDFRFPGRVAEDIALDMGFQGETEPKGEGIEKGPFDQFLDKVEQLRQEGDERQLIVLFDALNENAEADDLLRGIVNQIARPDAPAWLKVVITCRTEPWERSIRFVKGVDLSHFYTAGEGGEIVSLTQFDEQEVERAYEQTYGLRPAFTELSSPTQRLFADPLMLNLAYQVYGQEDRELPPALHQNQLLGQYVKRLLIEEPRDQFEAKLDLLSRLLRLMYELKKAELTLEEAERDPEVRRVFLEKADLPDSPYIQLLSALLREYPLKETKTITLRVERVFEFVLARHVLREEAEKAGWDTEWIADRLKESQEFANLWGAIRVLLIDYLEERDLDYETVERIARYERYDVGRMLADVLIILKGQHEERVHKVVGRLIRDAQSDKERGGVYKGEVAIAVARRFDWTDVFEVGASSDIPAVRLASVRAAYYLWRRDREKGVEFITRLTNLARREVWTAIPKALMVGVSNWIKGRLPGGKERGGEDSQEQLLGSLQISESFLNVTSLMMAHCLREPEVTQDLRRVWAPLLNSLDRLARLRVPIDRILRTLGVALVKRGTGGSRATTGHSGAPVTTFEGYAYFTHRSLDDPLRREALGWLDECERSPVPYGNHFFQRKETLQALPPAEREKGSLEPFLDEFIDFMKKVDTFTHYITGAMFLARAHLYPEQVLTICQRLCESDSTDSENLWAHYQSTTKLAVYLYVDPDPPEEHFEFLRRQVLWIWKDSTKRFKTPIYNEAASLEREKEVLLDQLTYPIMHECRPNKRTRGRLSFVDELLNQPWTDPPVERELRVILHLGQAAVLGHIAYHTNVIPILDTLQGWFNLEREERFKQHDKERLLDELAKALSRVQTFFPDEVERYLDLAPASLRERVAREREQPMYAIVFLSWITAVPWLWEQKAFREGMIRAMREITQDATSVQDAVEAVATYVFNMNSLRSMLGGWQ